MPQQKISGRKAVLAIKTQSGAGVWSTPTAAADSILVTTPSITFDPQQISTDEVGPSLDARAPLIGGMQIGINFGFYLKGPGVPGVEPEYSPVLHIGGLKPTVVRTDITGTDIAAVASGNKFTVTSTNITALTVGTPIWVSGFATAANNGEFLVSATASNEISVTKTDGSAAGLVNEAATPSVTLARGIAGVAATAGTTTSFTAQSPWSSTDQAYRFMPVLLSGNPATPAFSQIQDYTTGRVATITDLMGSALSASTKAGIPPHVLFTLASTSLPWASGAFWMDGRLFQVRDLVAASLRLTCNAAGAWMVEAALRGVLYADPTDDALPSATYDGTRPGIWRGSKFLLNRTAVSLQSLQISIENTVVFPPNPNESEGFEAPIITQRSVTGSMDPHMTLSATRDNIKDMRAGTPRPIHALLKGGQANAPGARAAAAVPLAYYTAVSLGDQSSLKTESTNFFCDGFDAGFGLPIY